jgi:hypothetical protein
LQGAAGTQGGQAQTCVTQKGAALFGKFGGVDEVHGDILEVRKK